MKRLIIGFLAAFFAIGGVIGQESGLNPTTGIKKGSGVALEFLGTDTAAGSITLGRLKYKNFGSEFYRYYNSSIVKSTQWKHSSRDFPLGTLIKTDIDYSQTTGDAWIMRIQGNVYGSIIPMDVQVQGYIYNNNAMWNGGGLSNGTNITGMVVFNLSGKLCFWYPSQNYWSGYNVIVYRAQQDQNYNCVTSITNEAKPTSVTKEFPVSSEIRQSLHSGNFTNYSPTLTGGGASGTWGINVTGNAGSVPWVGVISKPTNFMYASTGNGLNNDNTYLNVRVLQNSNTTSSNDGLFLGYNNSNNGVTRLYGGGSVSTNVEIGLNMANFNGVGINTNEGINSAKNITTSINATNNGHWRSMRWGFSGGNYGGFGYGYDYTGTSDSHVAMTTDVPTRVDMNSGLNILSSTVARTVGQPITWTSVASINLNQFTYKGNTVLHSGNISSYIPTTPTIDQVLGVGNNTNTNDLIFGLGSGASYRSSGIYGNYDPTKPQHIWGMGSGYRINASGADYGNFYGLAYSYEKDYGAVGNNSQGIQGLGHQVGWHANGIVQTAIGTGIHTIGNITGLQNLNLQGSAYLNGNLQINSTIGGSGIDYRVGGVARMFSRYDGVDNLNEGSLRWYSYNNDGSYYNNIMDLYRNGNLRLGGILDNTSSGGGIGLTNKIRLYNTGASTEDVTSNSYGFGLNHSTGRVSYSAGQNGYHSWFTQNVERLRVNFDGSTSIYGNLLNGGNIITNSSSVIRAGNDNTKGFIVLNDANSTDYSGYLEFYTPNQLRAGYIGFAQNGGNIQYTAYGTSKHQFNGDVVFSTGVTGNNALFSGNIKSNNQFQGGFGATSTTTGTTDDWNHISAKTSGNGTYLLNESSLNASPNMSGYYHPFNFEYSSKDGTGNFCQVAFPYFGNDIWVRGWYNGIGYRDWKTYIQSSKIQDVGSNDILHSGNISSYVNNASWLTTGMLSDNRLSSNIPLLNSTQNIFDGILGSNQNVVRFGSTTKLALENGGSNNSGYIGFFRPNGQRSGYIGFSTNTGDVNYVSENGANHNFQGGNALFQNNVSIGGSLIANGFNNRLSSNLVGAVANTDEIYLRDRSQTNNNDLVKSILPKDFFSTFQKSDTFAMTTNGGYKLFQLSNEFIETVDIERYGIVTTFDSIDIRLPNAQMFNDNHQIVTKLNGSYLMGGAGKKIKLTNFAGVTQEEIVVDTLDILSAKNEYNNTVLREASITWIYIKKKNKWRIGNFTYFP